MTDRTLNTHCRSTKSGLIMGASLLAMTSSAAFAQTIPDTDPPADDNVIVVTGIRASQQAATDIKRNSAQIVDAIVATDIGKLPDATIADFLQRIPGVQIRRDAGEGASLNIRGLGQVNTLLNGETFIAPSSITTIQPNYSDIPSQLFAGAEVYKSLSPKLLNSGLSGTVNLKTLRPFDLSQTFTLSATAEGVYNDRKDELTPSVSGLAAYKGDRFGVLVSAAYSNVVLSGDSVGVTGGFNLRNEGPSGGNSFQADNGTNPVGTPVIVRGTPIFAGGTLVGYDVNGDGDATDSFATPQNHSSTQGEIERERLGVSASIQALLSDNLTVTLDGFYSKQDEYRRNVISQINNVRFRRAHYIPGESIDTGATDANGYTINFVRRFDFDLPNFDIQSTGETTKAETLNTSAMLEYDNGDNFRASVRGIYSDASSEKDNIYFQTSTTNGAQWQPGGIGNYPDSIGGDRVFNAAGYPVLTVPAVADYTNNTLEFTLPPEVLSLLGNPANYGVKTASSENNVYATTDQIAFRADAELDFEDNWTLGAGVRYGDRQTVNDFFDRTVRKYAGIATDPAGCLIKWRAFDVTLSNSACQAPDGAGGFYTAGLTRKLDDPSLGGAFSVYQPIGSPAVLALDPKEFDDIAAFMERYDPGNINTSNPGLSYGVGVEQISGYGSLVYEGDEGTLSMGLQVINTKLDIMRNLVGENRPYGVAAEDLGDENISRSFTDFLPTINASYNLTDNLKVRAAYSKTMTLLNLQEWGGGLALNFGLENAATQLFAVLGGNQIGNPDLEPWRASNFDLSLEWYTGPGDIISVGLFNIEVDSFIQNGTVARNDLPDSDGVVRRTVNVNTRVQGAGATLQGLEFGLRQTFDQLPGPLAYTGVDVNYTLSLSDQDKDDLAGNALPFPDNSKHQANASLWYDDGKFEARVAYNYRSKRLVSVDSGGIPGNALYQKPTSYVDASLSYEFIDGFTAFGQVSNLTNEEEQYYDTFVDAFNSANYFGRTYRFGLRAKF